MLVDATVSFEIQDLVTEVTAHLVNVRNVDNLEVLKVNEAADLRTRKRLETKSRFLVTGSRL